MTGNDDDDDDDSDSDDSVVNGYIRLSFFMRNYILVTLLIPTIIQKLATDF